MYSGLLDQKKMWCMCLKKFCRWWSSSVVLLVFRLPVDFLPVSTAEAAAAAAAAAEVTTEQ